MTEQIFLRCAVEVPEVAWSQLNIDHLAAMEVPTTILGRRRSLLKGDAHRQWARWFVDSLSDPGAFRTPRDDYIAVFQDVLRTVEGTYAGQMTRPELREVAAIAARAIYSTVVNRRSQSVRRAISKEQRVLLVQLSGSPARCWICGSIFKQEIIDGFLDRRAVAAQSDPFVDILRPRGLNSRDYCIEVDHVVPLSTGGLDEDNLRLACGWCNVVKSAYASLYDVEGRTKQVAPNDLRLYSLPQPFWVVRTLATVGKCEHPLGCERSTRDSEMTIAPIRRGGALNPANLRVTCLEHDPLADVRLQSPSVVRRLWGIAN